MENKQNNPVYMKGYLKYALEFEKYVYIWSRAMDNANDRMRQICAERKNLENTKAAIQSRLDSFDNTNETQRRKNETDAVRFARKSKVMLIIVIVFMAILFAGGCYVGYITLHDPDKTVPIPDSLVIPAYGIRIMISGSLFGGVLPVCLVLFFLFRSKTARCKKEAIKLRDRNVGRQQIMMLQAERQQTEDNISLNAVEELTLTQQQDEIHNALLSAQNNLSQIYRENVLPKVYRNITAVATMYEYLETGRCNTIQGHGGIYDTYEVERLQLEQLYQMIRMNETLSRIEDNQRYIYRELKQANRTLSSIDASLREISRSNAEIARNTAISAAADKQTAEATRWISWNTWINNR